MRNTQAMCGATQVQSAEFEDAYGAGILAIVHDLPVFRSGLASAFGGRPEFGHVTD